MQIEYIFSVTHSFVQQPIHCHFVKKKRRKKEKSIVM